MRRVLLILMSLLLALDMGVIAAGDPGDTADDVGNEVEEAVAGGAGYFTAEQAEHGNQVYMQHCAGCHGDNLLGGHGFPSLAGGGFMTFWRGSTGADLYTIVKTMPLGRPNSLTEQEYLAVTARILEANNYEAGSNELTADPEALSQIVIEPQE